MRFLYRGLNLPNGGVVSGSIAADTREEAIDALSRQSIRVTHLGLASASSPSGLGKTHSAPVRAPSGSARDEEEAQGIPLPSMLSGMGLRERSIIGVAALLAIMGAFYLGRPIVDGGRRSQPSPGQKSFVQITISGRLLLPSGVDLAQVRAHVHLPEIPLDIFRSGKELFTDKNGRFVITTRMEARRRPAVFSFAAQAPGTGWLEVAKLVDQPLTLDQGGDDSALSGHLNDVKLSPAKPVPKAAPPVIEDPQPGYSHPRRSLPRRGVTGIVEGRREDER